MCLSAAVICPLHAQQAQNRPYVDDKLFHFGFQLGLNFSSFSVTDSQVPVTYLNENGVEKTDTLHARVSGVLPGFHVGFVTDLRLSQHLNLRFCPGMQFTSRTLTYREKVIEGGEEVFKPVKSTYFASSVDVLAMPVYLPLYLKWSAEREGNYRPYVIAGGGVSFNVSRDKDKPVLLNLMDYFCEVGFGVDFYAKWFKFCPEITYRIGFANQLCPLDQREDNFSQIKEGETTRNDFFYSNAISRLTSHCVCLTFNFE